MGFVSSMSFQSANREQPMKSRKPKIGLALGGGAARGWAHIGVIRALAERGIAPQVVAGCSIGSLVGAALASDQLEALADWVASLNRLDVLRLLDTSFKGGVITGERVMTAVSEYLTDQNIDELGMTFGAVATDLETGREIWLREGLVMDAVRASCGLPGLFSPTYHQDRWLIDGGVVNPVPVSLCHAMGADCVIAVNLNTGRSGFSDAQREEEPERKEEPASEAEASYLERFASFASSWLPSTDQPNQREPGLLDVLSASVNIMQERITRSRLAGDPPAVEIQPRVNGIQLMDFHLSEEAIAEGEQAVKRVAHQLEDLVERLN